MRLKVIASSSKGNCYIIGNKEEILILECGVTFASIKKGIDMKEIWKDIRGVYKESYQISNFGRVKSKDRVVPYKNGSPRKLKGRILKLNGANDLYYIVNLFYKGKRASITVHRLVAEHFIPNPLNLPQINHKDFNKRNNIVSNLEWVTPKQNCAHAAADGRIGGKPGLYGQHKNPIIQYTLEGKFIARHINAGCAERATNICAKNINLVANKTLLPSGNPRSQAGGYIWRKEGEAL